ncbi:MAG TPA: hypothetical protein PLM53_07770 [Spirochaetota bacterium]|nr:hypothetical protein [Spirochaetota bacterium]HPC41254.1 hypothetical protein [Spirochaetota bacterium]HPL15707.1 hypothetical protein [Spirochaetota bacterium]HQF08134.1 hypothetical protein [Spirochaetota bacterium]HQH96979.1 hypothetical protein [Spirochaetota bacterium]
MKLKKQRIFITGLLVVIVISCTISLFSRQFDFIPIDIKKISSYDSDRVVFQHVEKFFDVAKDNSYETLMVIKDRKTFLLVDGYDDPNDAKVRRWKAQMQNEYGENEYDLVWTNKINTKPDYIEIWDRKVMVMKNANEEFVSSNFGTFYKSIRDKFIKEHVDKFHQILRNRREADIYVDRKALPRPIYIEDMNKYADKYYTFVKARAFDGTQYSCEDADGDGVTETFMVSAKDGFNWGYKSGPDLIFIIKNTDKDIETLIGKLANEVVFGSVEDEKDMIETFPKEKDINDMIKWVTPKDPNEKIR